MVIADAFPLDLPVAPVSAAVDPVTEPAATGDPDVDLLRRTAAGDDDAFAELVNRHQERLLRLCQRLLGRRDEALDAVQDVFLKVYRKAGAYQHRGKVYTWMYRIATNHCFNQLRRRKIVRFVGLERGYADEDADTYLLDPPDPAAGPERALEARRHWQATRRLIDQLPENQRAVLVLAKFEGLSYREIAEVLDITVGAVESRLFRAMRRISRAQQDLR
ncbi:MAG: sigma-70 family RNA polymerase sigma factor [Acidobacteriota bacterium]